MKKGVVDSKVNLEFKLLGLDSPEIILIIANIIPIFGLLFFNWSLFSILILYWLESGIVGFYTILKILISNGFPNTPEADKYSSTQKITVNIIFKVILIPFFIVHYGAFMAGHLIGIWLLSSFSKIQINLSQIILSVLLSLITLFISHGISFYKNFIKNKEYTKTFGPMLMIAPYKRIFVMHIIIIFGAFIIFLTNLPEIVGLLLIILKTTIDFIAHRKEHSQFR